MKKIIGIGEYASSKSPDILITLGWVHVLVFVSGIKIKKLED
nr:hypothetical protein [Marinitoga lauensis]